MFFLMLFKYVYSRGYGIKEKNEHGGDSGLAGGSWPTVGGVGDWFTQRKGTSTDDHRGFRQVTPDPPGIDTIIGPIARTHNDPP